LLPDEILIGKVNLTQVLKKEFIRIGNPVINGKNAYGSQKVVRGEISFFLQPGETLALKQTPIYVLTAQQAIEVLCLTSFEDNSTGESIKRHVGEEWLIQGPREYCPTVEVSVLRNRQAITFGDNLNFFYDANYYAKNFALVFVSIVFLIYFIRRLL